MIVSVAYWAVYAVIVFKVPPEKIARGPILSAWLRRLVRLRPSAFRFAQIAAATAARIVLSGAGLESIGRTVFWTYIIGIFLDDYLSGDDPWWKRATGKVKLRMPAPVKLRPIERPTPCIGLPLQ